MNDNNFLFINERIINRFMTLKEFKKYNDSNYEKLLVDIFSKIINNNYMPNDLKLDNNSLVDDLICFYDNINTKRQKHYETQVKKITTYYKKKEKENKETFFSIEDTVSRITYKRSDKISKSLCFSICSNLIKTKAESVFSDLFISICQYVFDDEFNHQIDNLAIKFGYKTNNLSHSQFLYIKSLIDSNNQSYIKKIEEDNIKKNNEKKETKKEAVETKKETTRRVVRNVVNMQQEREKESKGNEL